MANMDGVGFGSCHGIVCGIDNLVEYARGLGDFLNSDGRPLIVYCKIQLCLFVASSFPHRHDLASTPWVGSMVGFKDDAPVMVFSDRKCADTGSNSGHPCVLDKTICERFKPGHRRAFGSNPYGR